jgi:hypothetical protein
LGTAIEILYTAPTAPRPAVSGRLQADIERAASLDGRTVNEMFDLYGTYCDATSPSLFEQDLGSKDFVVLRDDAGAVAGFSTLATVDAPFGRAIYSGDTIIDRAHWGDAGAGLHMAALRRYSLTAVICSTSPPG